MKPFMTKHEYFFYEWCILEKKISPEQAAILTSDEWTNLKKEYLNSLYGERSINK
jgi:hypothetical protein